jgi:superfamily II DNA helicase RecQ
LIYNAQNYRWIIAEEAGNLAKNVLSEKDLDVEEKKVMGRVIDMWSLGSETDPYSQSTISEIIKYSKKDGFTEEQILAILKRLEEYKLIRIDEVDGKTYIKYKADANQVVKELQKTQYSNSRRKFIPPHH